MLAEITEEQKVRWARDNSHIPTAQIEQDISDTEVEIEQLDREMRGYELVGDRLSRFKAEYRRGEIEKRQSFIARLRAILEVRQR
jgi:chaperonin cofactor prefoldin